MMADGVDEAEVAAIKTAKTKNGNNVSVQAFFTSKLGTTAGERMFKEFVNFVNETTQSLPGSPGVLLDTKAGRVISVVET